MKILWWRILLAGFLMEVLYVAYVFGVLGSSGGAYTVAGLSGVFVLMMLGGFWVGRTAEVLHTLQGGLVGLTANLLFMAAVAILVALSNGEATAPAEATVAMRSLNFSVKILAGAFGGFVGGLSVMGSRQTGL